MSGKGGEFERDICKFLTVWLTGKPKPYAFWRMPGSGSFATISEENVNMSGDIRGITSEGMEITDIISIECKTGYPKTSFWQHIKGTKGFNLKLFWIQCLEDAKKPGKHPILIYRKLRQKPMIGINNNTNNLLKTKLNNFNSICLHWSNDLPDLILYNFKDFFNAIKPKNIKELNEIKCNKKM